MYPKPKTLRPIFIGVVSLFTILVILSAGSCSSDNKHKKISPKPAVLSFEDSLYQSYIYTALSFKGDSLLKHLDSILPKTYTDNYRVRAYRNFLHGYKLFKQGKIDTAGHFLSNMLPKNGLDTARDYELLTLQKGALLLLKLRQGNKPGAFGQLMPALTLVEKYPARFRWWIYAMAAEAWYMTGEPLKAKSSAWLAYRSITDTGDYGLRGLLMYHIAQIEGFQDNLTGALQYADSAYFLAAKSEDKKLLSVIISTKALVLIKLGDTVNGKKLQQLALEQSKGVDKKELASQYFNMANGYYTTKNFKKAIYYSKQASELASEMDDAYGISSAYKTMADAYHALGQHDSSYQYLTLSYKYYLQYWNELHVKEIASLGVQHDLEKETNERKGLAEKSKVQEAEIKSKNTIVGQQRIIIFGGVLLLVLLLVLVYVIVRQARLRSAKVRAETEKEKIQLQQRLYRSQMEPHFIYNTLAGSVGFIRGGKLDEAEEYLIKFGRLLRVNLEHSLQSYVPLTQEIEALENYLGLQQMRFDKLFEYQINIYEGYGEDDLYIPPMLLQPFAENAVYHGFHDIDYKGQIAVVITKAAGWLHCEIEDNGRGLKNVINTTEKRSVATSITRDRLRILSQDSNLKKADLQVIDKIERGIERGTLVVMDIPFKTYYSEQV